MRVTDRERLVLEAMQLQANAPISVIQKRTGLRPHTIRYSLKRVLDNGIARSYTLINVYPLGFSKFGVFFSIASDDPTRRTMAIEQLIAMKSVVSILEIFGEYEYFISIAARGIQHLSSILDEISSRVGDIFLHKDFAARISLTLYQRTYLTGSSRRREFITYEMTGERCELSAEDLKIISRLDQGGVPSIEDIARHCKIPASTVNFRMKRLRKMKVVCGHLLALDPRSLGMAVVDVLVATKGIGGHKRQEIHDICLECPHIVGLARCIGAWDYEIRVEIENPHRIAEITNILKARLGSAITKMRTISVFRELKCMRAPVIAQATNS